MAETLPCVKGIIIQKTRDPIAAVSPWTAKKKASMPEGATQIRLLVDEDGAKLIADGILPDYVIEQACRALEWCCSDARGYVKASCK